MKDYNHNAITIFYKKPVNYNIAPRRGIRRDIGHTTVPHISALSAKVAEINAIRGFRVIEAVNVSCKRVYLEVCPA